MARRFTVRGRVQGVGFRAFVWREASDLGLTGWARNRYDGTVEVLAVGTSDALGELQRRLLEGPRWSRVAGVEPNDEQEVPVRAGFAVRPDA